MDKGTKLIEILESEQFQKEVVAVTTPEDMQQLIAAHGVELTVDEVMELCGQIVRTMNGDEITEAELDNVAGGVVILGITIGTAKLVALGVGCVGAAALGLWNGYWSNRK